MNKANKYRAHIIRMYITAITALNSGKLIVRLPKKNWLLFKKFVSENLMLNTTTSRNTMKIYST